MESAGVMATVLPLMSSGLLMFFSAKPMADIGLVCSNTPVEIDRRALDGGAHHGRHVDIAELDGLGGDGLGGRRGAAAFLDFEIDAFGGVNALFLAVIERRVLAIDVPVQHQHDLVGRRRRSRASSQPAPPKTLSSIASFSSSRWCLSAPLRAALLFAAHAATISPGAGWHARELPGARSGRRSRTAPRRSAPAHQRREHRRQFEIADRALQHVADAGIGADEFADHRADHRQRHRNLQP